jgi:hypothetical protein
LLEEQWAASWGKQEQREADREQHEHGLSCDAKVDDLDVDVAVVVVAIVVMMFMSALHGPSKPWEPTCTCAPLHCAPIRAAQATSNTAAVVRFISAKV